MKLINRIGKLTTNNQLFYVFLILTILIANGIITLSRNYRIENRSFQGYSKTLQHYDETESAIMHIDKEFKVDEEFNTHLPIVIIDTQGIEPPICTIENIEEERFVRIEGIDPYIEGTISVIDGNENNIITDNPTQTSLIKIKRRGNSSMMYDKGQYLIKLFTENGEDKQLSILNMGEDNEWVLNGSMADKSMMRNYLAYHLSAQMLKYTPDNVFCEVLEKKGDTYIYQGVYLMGESVKQGVDRVDIQEFDPEDTYNSYLVRRDRFDEEENILNTYATDAGFTNTHIGLLYPGKLKTTDEMLKYAEDDISKIESVLYSDDYRIFSTYPDYIDVDSFIDYFLINEFLASYDAGNYSTYMYKDVGGKLTMGPVWDFDGTMDNYRKEPLETEVTAFQYKPWFDRLMKDLTFVRKLENRYAELRRNVLSEKNVTGKIDEIRDYLGGAQLREWYRWDSVYTNDNKYSLQPFLDDDDEILYRESSHYEQEIYRLKTALRKHGDALQERLSLLELSTTCETGWMSRMNIWLILIGIIFCGAAIYAERS
jgi:hypothetical protein